VRGAFKAHDLGVTLIKAALVCWAYMHLHHRPSLKRLAAVCSWSCWP
jgi:hypothetical protein